MNLMIVESPNKIKKIKAILGSGWDVAASVGHIRDLPVKSLGVEPNTYRLEYQKHPRPGFELLDYAHFANKFAAHGERHKADLTYATYSLQRGVSEIEIRDTIRTHASTSAFVNRSQRDQDAYIERTVRKALKQNGLSIPIQPSFRTAELCR